MSNSLKMVHLQNVQSFETSIETENPQSYEKIGYRYSVF